MNRRHLFWLLGILLVALALGYFFDRTRRDAAVLAEQSFPAVRMLGDLRDLLSRVQMDVLEERGLGAPSAAVRPDERNRELEQAAEVIERYRATIVNPAGNILRDRVASAFGEYRNRLEQLQSTGEGAAEEAERLRECVQAYDRLHSELAALRSHRLERVEDRISRMDRAARRGWRTNLVALALLFGAIIACWIGIHKTAHDAHDE